MKQHGDLAEKLCTKNCLTMKKENLIETWLLSIRFNQKASVLRKMNNVCISMIAEVFIESQGVHIDFPKDGKCSTVFSNFSKQFCSQ